MSKNVFLDIFTPEELAVQLERTLKERDALKAVYETCRAYHDMSRTDSLVDRMDAMFKAILDYEKENA